MGKSKIWQAFLGVKKQGDKHLGFISKTAESKMALQKKLGWSTKWGGGNIAFEYIYLLNKNELIPAAQANYLSLRLNPSLFRLAFLGTLEIKSHFYFTLEQSRHDIDESSGSSYYLFIQTSLKHRYYNICTVFSPTLHLLVC